MKTECPECGSPDTKTAGHVNPARQGGPGEWYWYRCADCTYCFKAIMPEPPDDYEGDGVFAENH